MKTITVERLQQLPSGFQESIIERSRISAAISNCNTFIKYANKCKRYAKEFNDESWNEQGLNSLMPYYKELLNIEWLANKYSFLWLEKFSKTKHIAEKILNIGL